MSDKLFLIVLLPKAKAQLEERGWLDGLEDELRSLRTARLYHLPHKKDAAQIAVALPFLDGRTLLLKKDDRDDSRDYFICAGAENFSRPDAPPSHYHELSPDVEIRLVESFQIERYLSYAVDCGEIDREVKAKLPWKPHKGGGPEANKWRAYLDLYKKMLDDQRFGLPAHNIKIAGKTATVSPDFSGMPDVDDSEIAEKIRGARGEPVHFSMTADAVELSGKRYPKAELGKLRSYEDVMKIALDKDFSESLRAQIKAGEFYFRAPESIRREGKDGSTDGDGAHTSRMGVFVKYAGDKSAASQESAEKSGAQPCDESESDASVFDFVRADGQQFVDFYYDESVETKAFSCQAVREKFVWKIDPDSIVPHRMMLFAEFIGDFYQIGVMRRGLKKIQKLPIWEVLSGERVSKLPEDVDVQWADDCILNYRQKEAVKKALGAKELCLIWGPPGTGKTEVIAEIARQEALQGNKTLIASQANLAVDNALGRLHCVSGAWTFRVAKDGYELEGDDKEKVPMQKTAGYFLSRHLCERLKTAIDLMLPPCDDDVRKLREQFIKRLQKKSGAQPDRAVAQMAELYRGRINVVGATLMRTGKSEWNDDPETGKRDWGSERNKLRSDLKIENKFDVVIVDEVSKAMPPELFLPILQGKRVVLVGDHKQLPPMFKLVSGDDLELDDWAEESGIPKEELKHDVRNTTIFGELWKKHGGEASPVRAMLTTQYRMHRNIQNLIEQFYADEEGALECGLSEDKLREMPLAADGVFSNTAVWVDTTNDAHETRMGTSFVNNDEIRIVGKILNALPRGDLSVGVITFYGAQLGKLRELYETHFADKFPDGKLIFGTVDRFQGRECDVVICSLVRKNKNGNIGFARKTERINVAFSRARRLLCIVGNSGQFCYESAGDAQKAYKCVFKSCKRAFENDVTEQL